MTNKVNTLNEVFLEELSDLYSAEKQLIKALPKMADAVNSQELERSLREHLEETKNHASRLEEIFRTLGHKPISMTCKAMKGLIEEGEEVIKKRDRSAARDAAIIGAAQRVEHYEIAGYGTAHNHAELLGHESVSELLGETLQEEKQADTTLNDLAEGSINVQAMQPVV